MNNIVEQDHRFMRRKINPGLDFGSSPTVWRTIQGYETMHMVRKVKKGNIQGQNEFNAGLFGLAA
jgi:IS6 family transposase